MIVAEDLGEITQIRMGRNIDGQVLYWGAAYLVDNLLIDTGCHHTANKKLTLHTSISKIVPKGSGAINRCLDYLQSIGLEAGHLYCEGNLTKQQTPQEERTHLQSSGYV